MMIKQIPSYLRSWLLLAVLVLCSLAGIAQSSVDKVYLKNGEYYEGEIIAIGTQVILIKTSERIFSVNRSEVNYLFSSEERQLRSASNTTYRKSSSTTKEKVDWFKPVDKKFVVELGGGIHMFSPFSLNLSINGFYNINDRWAVGPSMNLDFFRYVMLRYGLHVRHYKQVKRFLKTYSTMSVGVSPWAEVLFNNDPLGDIATYSFSPILHGSAGLGMWIDTGIKLAFTTELGVGLVGYELEESLPDWTGGNMRTQTSQVLNVGPYFRLGMAF